MAETGKASSEHRTGEAERPRIAGIVLAAGRATRMGSPKQLLELGDRTLLQHVVDHALASSLDELVVVLGAEADAVEASLALPYSGRARIVRNPDYATGQASSLRAGLAGLGAAIDAAAVLLGDQPGVEATTIDGVLDAWRGSRARIVRPIYSQRHRRSPDSDERIPGHPVILAREIWPALADLGGDEGARGLIARHPDWLEAVEIDSEAPDDIDTPEDYQRRRNTRHSPPDRSA
jgi:molybdenum cofactor cytidylyltransferase